MKLADDGAQVRTTDGLATLPTCLAAHHHGFVFLLLKLWRRLGHRRRWCCIGERLRPPNAAVSHGGESMDTLDGRIALVTGASRGIGAAIARTLHQAGVRLGLASRSGDDLGLPDVVAQPADVRDPAALKAIADATAEHFGGIDILVVNAGVGAYGPFLELPQEQADEMIDVNVKGAIYAVRAGLPTCCGATAPTW